MAADPRTHLFSNNATARLASSLSSIATTIELEAGAGDLFPSPGSGEIFKLTVEDIIENKREIMHCTARSGDTLTVEREQEGTTAQQFTNLTNTTVQLRVTAGTLEYLAQSEAGDFAPDIYLPESNEILTYDGYSWINSKQRCEFQLACSDLTSSISAGTGKGYFRAPFRFRILEVRASLLTAAGSGTFTVDINRNGVSILSTKLTIDATEKTSTTAVTPAVISDDIVNDDNEISIDVDDAATSAVGLIVTIIGERL